MSILRDFRCGGFLPIIIDIVKSKLGIKINAQNRKRMVPCKLNRIIVQLCVKHLHGPSEIKCEPNELVVLCVVRNGAYYLKSFIDHYLSMGAKYIVIMDNGSTDDSIAIAAEFRNIIIIKTLLPYKVYANGFKSYLIDRYCRNCWCLCADIDEFFQYPFLEQVSLPTFLQYLNKRSYNAVLMHLLDMFRSSPLLNNQGTSIFERGKYNFFDITDIDKEIGSNSVKDQIVLYGGIRKTIFAQDRVLLSKTAMIYVDNNINIDSFDSHFFNGDPHIADVTCALLHYKFTDNFFKLTLDAIREENYWEESREYKAYYTVFSKSDKLNIVAYAKNPETYTGTLCLVKNGFIQVSDDYFKATGLPVPL